MPTCPCCNVVLIEGRCPACKRPVERFTDRARSTMIIANEAARSLHAYPDPHQPPPRWRSRIAEPAIRPAHLLIAINAGPTGVGQTVLRACVPDPDSMRRSVLMRLPTTIGSSGVMGLPAKLLPFQHHDRLPLSASMRRLIAHACEEAWSLNNDWVGTEHLLLALCRHGDLAARRALQAHAVRHEDVRALIMENLAAVYTQPPPLPT